MADSPGLSTTVTRVNPGPSLNVCCEITFIPHQFQSFTDALFQAATTKSRPGFGQTPSPVGEIEGGLSQPSQHPVPASHSHLPSEWINLAIAHHTRFERTGELDDLKRAIAAYGTSLAEIRTSVGEQDPKDATLFVRPILYFHLGTALTSLCRFTGKVEPVEQGTVALENAVKLGASLNHTSLPYFYSGLGNALFLRFELMKDVEDLKNAVKAFEDGLKVTPQSDRSALSVLHSNLGNPLSMLFEQTGEAALLDRSIGAYKTAIDLAPPNDSDAAASYASLARAFTTRFNRTGRPQDIEDAILVGRRAISLTPTGHHQLPDWLTILANALNSRFNLLKGVKDINEAVTLHRRAVELTPLQNVQFSSRSQHLGASLLDRFNHSGDLRDVEQAIISLHKAIDNCPSGHASLPYIYTNLGNALASRSRRTGELQFSDQAVAAHRMAVDLSLPTSERLSLFYSNLGASLMLRFGHNIKDNGKDLVEAISSIRKAIEISTANDVRGLATRYACLASALATRARHGAGVDGLESIEEALSVHQKIGELVSVTKEDGLRPLLDSQHIQKGDLLMDRYRISKDGRDLTKALASYEKALEAIPQGHPYLPSLHSCYAQAMMEQYQVSQNDPRHDNFKETALEHYRLAARSPSSSPLSRFNAARAWASFASVVDSPTNAMNAYQTCVDLLPIAAGLDQTLDRRHEMLVRISDLSRQASAFALSCGNPKRAVEWLEASRCLVWGQLNNLRTPLDDLREYDEELAERFARVSTTLEKSGTREGPYWDAGAGDSAELKVAISLQQEAVIHVELATEYEAILKRVRALPGFEHFLKAPSLDLLVKSLPKSGNVVIINIHETRCDAICLSPDNLDPLHVRLPDFSYEKAEQLRRRLRGLVDSVSVRMDEEGVGLDGEERKLVPFQLNKSARGYGKDSFVPSILRDLWILVAKPIVDALELSKSSQAHRKRLWWCLTGPLAFLPIHAAGIYSSTSVKENVALSDFAISTYIPTLKFLAKSSSPPNSLADGTRPLNLFLLISQSQTTGHSPTPGAAKEVESVAKTLDSHSIPNLALSEAGATVATTLEQIKTHNWVHFACHAYQDLDKPLNSSFVLNDGRLTLSEIVKLGMKNAELAYLSACQTSAGDGRLSEEAVHLAAGMLAAGFQGVVATMWSIRDRDAPQVAKDFYEYLLENSSEGGINSSLAAHALDHAVRRLRDKVGASDLDFLSWLPYVYFGM
ncbi:hypothetical protein EST38_g11749 [Candolleomyces aberdarensis]|uniref:CHAT domain-containing protein n=1 Tax=Candolleomyces aberdarensis TaxID=2316362 RepID=A0A4Q2D7F0_9AGAR|nr:hypothetical protein EST38_g11749 [Candolleomyces aberdarensis]